MACWWQNYKRGPCTHLWEFELWTEVFPWLALLAITSALQHSLQGVLCTAGAPRPCPVSHYLTLRALSKAHVQVRRCKAREARRALLLAPHSWQNEPSSRAPYCAGALQPSNHLPPCRKALSYRSSLCPPPHSSITPAAHPARAGTEWHLGRNSAEGSGPKLQLPLPPPAASPAAVPLLVIVRATPGTVGDSKSSLPAPPWLCLSVFRAGSGEPRL